MNDPLLEKVRQTVSDVFGMPVSEISADSSPETVEAWESLSHLNLVLALEQSFSVEFAPEEISAMTSVRQVADILVKKGASA